MAIRSRLRVVLVELDWGNPSQLRLVREELTHMVSLPGWRRFVDMAEACIDRSRSLTENPGVTEAVWRSEAGKIVAVRALIEWPADLLKDIQEVLESGQALEVVD